MFITNDALQLLENLLKEQNKKNIVFEFQEDKNKVVMRFDNINEKFGEIIYLNNAESISKNWVMVKKDNFVQVIKRNLVCKNGLCKIK